MNNAISSDKKIHFWAKFTPFDLKDLEIEWVLSIGRVKASVV